MNSPTNRIIVAVAGDDVEAMLRFSVDEALRSGAELRLVHVLYLPGVMLPETYAVAYAGAKEYAVTLLDHAVGVATSMVDGRVPVTSELVERSGSAVGDLVSRSADARLVVLQHRHLEGLHRLATTSTTLGVCARAHTPVVSVPEHWRPVEPPYDRVTVGVSNPDRADEALRAGFEVAQHRGSRLRVVHSWWLANGYDSALVDDDMRRDFSTRFRQEIAPHLEKLQQEFADVEVDVLVFHAQPAVGLMRAAEDSDVVIVGRRHWALPIGSHVGAVTRALLRWATCPVVIVETSPVADV
jgi:nucleotide-binding universal stress UspA family protein